MTPRLARVPDLAAEILRLLLVIAGAALGHQVGVALAGDGGAVLGVFDAPTVGVIVGAGLGYSLGGVLARRTVRAVDQGGDALAGLSSDELVAGSLGALVATALTALISWPLLLFGPVRATAALVVFLLVVAALLGFRVGRAARRPTAPATPDVAGTGTAPSDAPGVLPVVVDSSVAIDGRIVEVARAGFLPGPLLVPMPVIEELQGLADSADDTRRARGQRGLSILEALRAEPGVDLAAIGDEAPGVPQVDAKLVRICLDRPAGLLTCDVPLARTAALAGVRVLNMHQLARAVSPPVAVGDEMTVLLRRRGREPGQAVGHLEDGTMVVVEQAADRVGSRVLVRIASVIPTAGGRMAFAAPLEEAGR